MVAILVLAVSGSAVALDPGAMFTDGSDWEDEFFAGAAFWLGHAEVFIGDQDGNLFPGNPLTRVEMAVILARITGMEDAAESLMEEATDWTDDYDIPAWARGYMVLSQQQGWFQGYGDGTVQARFTLTWAEISILLARATGNAHLGTGNWPENAMTAGEAIGLFEGLPFEPVPGDPILRGNMVAVTWAAMRAGTHDEDADEWDREATLLDANFPATAEAYAEYLERPDHYRQLAGENGGARQPAGPFSSSILLQPGPTFTHLSK